MKRILVLLLFTVSLCAYGGYFFNRNDSGMPRASTDSLNITNAISISCWFKVQDFGDGLEQKSVLVCKGKLDFGADCVYMLRIKNAKMEFDYATASHTCSWATDNTFVFTNLIHHVAFSYAWGNLTNIFLLMDGVEQSGTWIAGGPLTNTVANAENFKVGAPTAQLVGGGIFGGIIDSMALWRTNLSRSEMRQLFTSRMEMTCVQIQPAWSVVLFPWHTVIEGISANTPIDLTIYHNSLPAGSGLGKASFNSYWPNQ